LRGGTFDATVDAVPSPPRDSAPGIHHAWVNATGKESYYVDDVDRLAWIRRLVRVAEQLRWTCIAFCQMTTHVHVLVAVPDRSLPIGMKRLNLDYSTGFNLRHGRVGQFVRRRYGSRRIELGSDLLGVYTYVVSNPVEAGLCPRAEDWRWSSYATTLGISSDFRFVDASLVLDEVGGSTDALRALVAETYLAASATSGV
jgi:REP-associated tyrosine transposase